MRASFGHGGAGADDTVSCGAGHAPFCFRCRAREHKPASCAELSRWRAKDVGDGMSARWIVANTKQCPRCRLSIDRWTGCNKVVCSQCQLAFCWVSARARASAADSEAPLREEGRARRGRAARRRSAPPQQQQR